MADYAALIRPTGYTRFADIRPASRPRRFRDFAARRSPVSGVNTRAEPVTCNQNKQSPVSTELPTSESGTFYWLTDGGFGMALIIIELLCSIGIAAHGIGFAAYGIGHLIDALSQVPWGAIVDWFHVAPAMRMAPQLSLGNEAMHAQFQQLMESQYQLGELKRIILTLPALPSEGY
jgi:hypothetical protein